MDSIVPNATEAFRVRLQVCVRFVKNCCNNTPFQEKRIAKMEQLLGWRTWQMAIDPVLVMSELGLCGGSNGYRPWHHQSIKRSAKKIY